jgi:hypothetical protein
MNIEVANSTAVRNGRQTALILPLSEVTPVIRPGVRVNIAEVPVMILNAHSVPFKELTEQMAKKLGFPSLASFESRWDQLPHGLPSGSNPELFWVEFKRTR